MDLSLYRCPECFSSNWTTYSTLWECQRCKSKYLCKNGIPKLYLESQITQRDVSLRDHLYNGILGRFYQFVMPFLTLPARPIRLSCRYCLSYPPPSAFLPFPLWHAPCLFFLPA